MQRDEHVVVSLRPIATPLPLTFSGLLIASVVISAYELGWIPSSEHHTTGWVLLAVPIPLQLLAACWGFVARSACAATGSAVLTAVWLAFALDLITTAPGPPGPSNAIAMLMFGSAAALAVTVLAEVATGSLLPAVVLSATVLRFALTGVSGITHRTAWSHASGWVGIAVAALALYASFALELEGTKREPVLPTLRRGRARSAVDDGFAAQVADLEHEVGVRSNV